MRDGFEIINLTPNTIAEYGVCGYKNVKKHVELRKKISWFKKYYEKGLRIKIIMSKEGGYQGMIEYIPGLYAHRPVFAKGFLFIHCVFVGFKKEFKGRGFASTLIDECIHDAKRNKMDGVAVVTRKGSFMVDNDIFLKKGFTIVDKAPPDFSLLAYKLNDKAENPIFRNLEKSLSHYSNGLTIIRSPQCPYTEKNVQAIIKTARAKYHLTPQLIEMEHAEAVQQSPCPFGSFCIILDGTIISYHPISNTRFDNIMKQTISNS